MKYQRYQCDKMRSRVDYCIRHQHRVLLRDFKGRKCRSATFSPFKIPEKHTMLMSNATINPAPHFIALVEPILHRLIQTFTGFEPNNLNNKVKYLYKQLKISCLYFSFQKLNRGNVINRHSPHFKISEEHATPMPKAPITCSAFLINIII